MVVLYNLAGERQEMVACAELSALALGGHSTWKLGSLWIAVDRCGTGAPEAAGVTGRGVGLLALGSRGLGLV